MFNSVPLLLTILTHIAAVEQKLFGREGNLFGREGKLFGREGKLFGREGGS